MPFSMKLWQVQGKDLPGNQPRSVERRTAARGLGCERPEHARNRCTARRQTSDDGELWPHRSISHRRRGKPRGAGIEVNKTPREIVAQALDYASWVSGNG
jgi:hypothetical protein